MWNKIYTIALAVSAAIMLALTFYSYNLLNGRGFAPQTIQQNYEDYSGMARLFLWLSSIVLLVLANVLFWRLQQSWALWATYLYFAAFTIIQAFFLDDAFSTFKVANNLDSSRLSVTPFLGVIFCVLGAIIVFFDQFLVSRLHQKMFGVAPEAVKMEGGGSEF